MGVSHQARPSHIRVGAYHNEIKATEVQEPEMITVKVVCPVCQEPLTYEHKETEAWGSASVVAPHMREHYPDGSWGKELRRWAKKMARIRRSQA